MPRSSVFVVLVVALLAGCSAGKTAAPSPATPTPGPLPSACERIVSSLGWVEPLLVPAGREDEQVFDEAVRGRIAYVAGAVSEVRSRVPAQIRDQADRLEKDAESLSPAATPKREQVAALRRFRAEGAEIRRKCAGSQPSQGRN